MVLIKKKSEKKSSVYGLSTTVIAEKKEQNEIELVSKLKDKSEILLNITFGYFLGIIQNRIYNFESDLPDNILNEPNHLKKYKNNPLFKKILQENENKLNNNNISTSSINISQQNTFNFGEPKKSNEEKHLHSLLKNNKLKNKFSIEELNKYNDKSLEEEDGNNNISNRSHSIKTISNNNDLNNIAINSNGNSKKQNGVEMEVIDKLQNLQINLKDDLLEEQIKLLITKK